MKLEPTIGKAFDIETPEHHDTDIELLRLINRLRRAKPRAIRVVRMLLKELDKIDKL